MVTMYAPKGHDQVTVEGQNFKVNKDGAVEVPDNFVSTLKAVGFKEGPLRIEISDETAEAIKSTGKSDDDKKTGKPGKTD